MMARIILDNVSVSYPVYNQRNLSLRAQFSWSDRNRENFMKERDPFVPALYAFLATVNDTGVAPITVAGRTALSVETSTKRLLPASAAAAATIRVATALFCTAATGFSSISPTCL